MSEDYVAFIASAFNPGFGDEPIDGRILFDRWRLRFESPTLLLEIPLGRLQLEVEESSGGRVCFSDPEQPEWSLYTFDSRVLKHGPLQQQAHTRNQIRAIRERGELKRALKITVGFLVGFALIAGAISMLMGFMVRSLVARVPLEWEQEFGDSMLKELRDENQFSEDPKLMARLTNAVAPLVAALPPTGRKYQFYILEEPVPNAFALPGGHVLVTTGLMELTDRPEELAAVAAHEIAHVTERHLFRKVVSSAGPLMVCEMFAGGGGGVLSLLGAGSQLLVAQSFSQEYEMEADAVGWDYLVRARIDPRAAPEILKKLKTVEDKTEQDAEPRALSSHPATEKRIRRLEAKWKKLKNKTGFIQFNALEPQAAVQE